jgi:hypothetical protein
MKPSKESKAMGDTWSKCGTKTVSAAIAALRELEFSETRIESLLFAHGHSKQRVRELMAKKKGGK